MRQGVRKVKENKKKLLQELQKTSGIVAFACQKAGVSRVTFYKYRKDDPEFAEQVQDIMEVQIDVAESALLKKIRDKDLTAIIFYLKTKGKERGYIERHDYDHRMRHEVTQETAQEISYLMKKYIKARNDK